MVQFRVIIYHKVLLIRIRDVNGTRISRVPKIVPVPGKKISRTGIFGKSLNSAPVYTVCVVKCLPVSGDVINVGGPVSHAVQLAAVYLPRLPRI